MSFFYEERSAIRGYASLLKDEEAVSSNGSKKYSLLGGRRKRCRGPINRTP
jgi:hypothetical protein